MFYRVLHVLVNAGIYSFDILFLLFPLFFLLVTHLNGRLYSELHFLSLTYDTLCSLSRQSM